MMLSGKDVIAMLVELLVAAERQARQTDHANVCAEVSAVARAAIRAAEAGDAAQAKILLIRATERYVQACGQKPVSSVIRAAIEQELDARGTRRG
jgi:hypothetical protein